MTGPARKTRRLADWNVSFHSSIQSRFSWKRAQREPLQPLKRSQARSRQLSSSVPQSPQLHPTIHFPDFPVSPEMLTGTLASSALWHDLPALPPAFNEIRVGNVTQWVLLFSCGNQSKHQDVFCRYQGRHGMTYQWDEKPISWRNFNTQKSSFQGDSGNKGGFIREGTEKGTLAGSCTNPGNLNAFDYQRWFTSVHSAHEVLWKMLHLSALTHYFTTWA